MAAAVGTAASVACNGQLRYQLADGEIIHTIYLSFSIFPALLTETGVPPPAPADTYPDVSEIELIVHKGAPSGYAGLDPGGKVPLAQLPTSGFELQSNKNAPDGYAGLSASSLIDPTQIPLDGTSIIVSGGKIQIGYILTSTQASFTTPTAGATQNIQVVDSSTLKVNQAIRFPVAGYYQVTNIADAHNITIKNLGDPANAGSGITIVSGTPLLPSPFALAGSSAISLTIGTVTTLTTGSPATATITGTAPDFVLNLGLPIGATGASLTPTLTIGTVSTLSSGSPATASIGGTAPNFILNLGIPQGQAGGGGGLSTLTDAEISTGESMIYDGPTGKLKRFAFDPLFDVQDQGTYWQINFPAYPRTQASFTMPAVGSNTASLNIQNQASAFLQPGMQVYLAGAGLMLVVSTGTSSGQDTAVFQNIGSQQGITNAVAGATISAGAWIAIVPSPDLTDAETTEGFSLIANGTTGQLKRILIPDWLEPDDSSGTEIKITAPTPLGAGDMKRSIYDLLTTAPATATPLGQVDQARIIVQPHLSTLRNYIDNALFKVRQRGTFPSPVTAAGFQLDRWQYVKIGSGSGAFSLQFTDNNITNSADSPFMAPGPFLTPTVLATPGAGDAYSYQQIIEGANYKDLVVNAQGPYPFITLRFWATVTGTSPTYPYLLGVSFISIASGNYYVTDVQINSGTLAEYIVTVPVDTSGAALNINPGTQGLQVAFSLGAGSAQRATLANTGIWTTAGGPKRATPNSTDFVNTSTALTLRLSQISLCLGKQPLKMHGLDYTEDLRRCQRFYCKSTNLAQIPGGAGQQADCGTFYVGAATLAYGNVRFPVDMYGVPTVKVYDPVNGGASGSGFVGSGTIAGLTPAFIGEKGFSQITGSGMTVGQVLQVGWEASAEI